jgi:hypothetical protein
MSSSFGDLTGYGSDDDSESDYLEICECGHSAGDHGADQSHIDRDEFARRGRVAVRLDEMLQVNSYFFCPDSLHMNKLL